MTAGRLTFAALLAALLLAQSVYAFRAFAGAVFASAGDAALSAGDIAGAATRFGRATRLVPYRGDWEYARAGAVRRVSGHEAALPVYESALRHAPYAEHALVAAAESCIDLGHIDEAKRYVERARTLMPQDWRVHRLIGFIATVEGRPQDTAAALRRAEELLGKPDVTILNPLANALYTLGDFVGAEREAVRALELQPLAPEHHLIRGKAQFALGDVAEARKEFAWSARAYRNRLDRGMDTGRFLAESEGWLATALAEEGRPLDALAPLNRLYADAPENALAAIEQLSPWLRRAEIVPEALWAFALDVLIDAGHVDEAAEVLDAITQPSGGQESVAYVPVRARILIARGRANDALELLSRAPESWKSTADARLAFARAHAALGNAGPARIEFRAALAAPDASPKTRRQAEDGLSALGQ